MPVMHHYHSVDAYISAQPDAQQPALKQLRDIVRKAVPDAAESILYSMPAYKLQGRPLVYFAACKTHYGFYPMPATILHFKNELTSFGTAKGTVRFSLNEPLPQKLIAAMVKFRAEEIQTLVARGAGKTTPVTKRKGTKVQ